MALLVLSIVVAAEPSAAQLPEEGCTPHPLIHITEDAGLEGFVLVPGVPVYRPGSGVTSGSGTQEDPYIIEGWCIVSEKDDGTGAIWLEDTSAHVVIRDNWILGPPTGDWRLGVLLEQASNVRIEDNDIQFQGTGVVIKKSDGIRITGNHIHETSFEGIQLQDSHDNVIKANTLVETGHRGLRFIYTATGNRIEGNTIEGAPDWGIMMHRDSNGNDVVGNTIRDNGGAIAISWSKNFQILDNVIEDNTKGIQIGTVKNTVIQGNNIDGNEQFGLNLLPTTGFVDATENWWGCLGGPDIPWCDQINGDNLDYEPYRTSPNPDAGA